LTRQPDIRTYRGKRPEIAASAYIDPAAVIIGDVVIGADSSIWPCSVVRGDVHYIRIGARTNIQDGCVLHVMRDEYPLLLARPNDVPAEAIRDCTSAQQSYAVAGDKNNEARTLNDLAGHYFQQGDLVRAQAMWLQAASEFRQVGDLEGLAATSNNLGDVLLLQGNLRQAKQSLEEALPNYQAIEDKDGVARVLMRGLIVCAKRRGFELLEGTVLRANEPMQAFVRSLGFSIVDDPGDATQLIARLPLG